MDILDNDIINLWQTLNKNNVLYIMVVALQQLFMEEAE